MSGRYSSRKKRSMRRENAEDIIRIHMETYGDLIKNRYEHDKLPEFIIAPLTLPKDYKSRWTTE
ncbi:hypothetical protein EU538_07470 [Candidatus Thorarchaeota archaeon]|nr:MAG: hypothetical protein EU538_07470 [Candidatus Thorarchaeota archaeon]